jgi:uncharacterized protein (DUF885 family)
MRTLIVAALLAALAAPGASRAAGAPPAAAPAARLNELVEGYWQEYLALNPLAATFLGDHRYDDRLPNSIGAAHLALELALERRYLERLGPIDPARLDDQQRLTHEIFGRDRRIRIEGFRYESELLPFDQFRGLPQLIAQLGTGAGAQPFRTTADYENWLRRVEGFVVWTDQAIVNMRRGAAKGITQPRVLLERVLPELAALVAPDPAQSVFYRPVAEFPTTVPAADQPRLRAAFVRAITQRLNPAYLRLHDFIRDEYLPQARTTIAFSDLPLGKDWYGYRIRLLTTTDLTPAAIHAIGLAEVARIGTDMDRVIAAVGFKGDRKAFLDSLRADPRFYYEQPDDLLNGYRALKERIRARLAEQFDLAPRADFEIRPVEPFRARAQASASYQSAAPDGTRPGIFYVNTFDLKSRPKYLMESIYLHEAEPGHHFQVSIKQELTDLPSFRRFGNYGAYDEGWGLYAESLGRDLGLYTDPYEQFGALSAEIWRAARLVVDTGIHAQGWSRQRAIDYLLANSGLGATDAAAEVDRYIAMPGQALTYKLGELKIKELKLRAQRALGVRYDQRLFHRALLDAGSVPLDVLDAKLTRWIAARKAAP